MRKPYGMLAVALVAFTAAMAPSAALAGRPPKTFVAVLSAGEEVPPCPAAGNSSRGTAVFHVRDRAAGTVEYKLVANNIPGTTTQAHIHIAPRGVAGPIVQPLPFRPGEENGVIGRGTFTNPALVAALQANPRAYYVNVHSTECPPGAIRGQLGEHGPPGTAER